jgi:pimeloyl-ACP methyl ester carboxylesterase
LGTVLGGISLGWIALHPGRRSLTTEDQRNAEAAAQDENAELSNVQITASDDTPLRAWYIRPAEPNGSAVILLHGVGDNRLGVYGYGDWLVKNHYSVLLPDARAHGLSGGELATYGLTEADDIHEWVNWLEERNRSGCVFGFGESMGAAQLLQSLAKESRFCRVVAESPFASFREVAYARFGRPFHTGPWLGRTFFRPTVEGGFLFVRLRYGLNMEAASPEQAVAGTKVPVLLIHGLSDQNIPSYHSDLIRAHNPSHIVVWHVSGAGHCGSYQASPEEFDRRVLAWLSTMTNLPMEPRSLNTILPLIFANKVSSLPRPTFRPGFTRVPR